MHFILVIKIEDKYAMVLLKSFIEKVRNTFVVTTPSITEVLSYADSLLKGEAIQVSFTEAPYAWFQSLQELQKAINTRPEGTLILIEIHTIEEYIADYHFTILNDLAEWLESEEGIEQRVILHDKTLKSRIDQETKKFLEFYKDKNIIGVRIDLSYPNGLRLGYSVRDEQILENAKDKYFELISDKFEDYIPPQVQDFLNYPVSEFVKQVKNISESLNISLDDAFLEEASKFHVGPAVERLLQNPNKRAMEGSRIQAKVYKIWNLLHLDKGFIT